jgi:hypothetical protein
MRILRSVIHSRKGRIGVVATVAAASVLLTASPAYALAMTLSASLGPVTGLNTVTATITPTTTLKFTTATAVQLQGSTATTPTCATAPATLSSTILAPKKVSYISSSKLGITMPVLSGASTPKFAVCAYNGTTLVANAVYTATAPPVVSTISPSAAPTQGGTVVTVTGQYFPATCAAGAGITVTIGGTALTGVTCLSTSSFQGIVPAHAPGVDLDVVVTTTAAGTGTLADAFTYQNGIVVTPSYAPNTKSTDLDIQGVGFSSLDFGDTTGSDPDSADAHVYLVPGTYNPAASGGHKAVQEVTECVNVLQIGDTELICTLVATQRFQADTATEPVEFAPKTISATSTGSTLTAVPLTDLTAADIGRVVDTAQPGITTARTITAVTNGVATLSGAVGTAQTVAIDFDLKERTVASVTATTTATTAGTFVAGDVGKTISGAGIPLGTTITAVDGVTGHATLSPALPAAISSGVTVTVGDPEPVPDGTYTLTVVSSGAQAPVTAPSQSVISSGSTFTIAAFN